MEFMNLRTAGVKGRGSADRPNRGGETESEAKQREIRADDRREVMKKEGCCYEVRRGDRTETLG